MTVPLDRAARDAAVARTIPLTLGLVAIVDAEDYAELSQFKWCAVRDHRSYYARRSSKQQPDGRRFTIRMHKEILGAPPEEGMITDHINGDGLDNRRCNLRFVTHAQNMQNRRDKRGTSLYRGVSASKGKWVAVLCHNGVRTRLGTFADEIDAARAWDEAASAAYGEYARLNLPHERVAA